jgi:hypothetical protein
VLKLAFPSTGYGQHADYLFGWEGDALTRAMNTCTTFAIGPSACATLKKQTVEVANQCTMKAQVVGEDTTACKLFALSPHSLHLTNVTGISKLPGDVVIN